MKVTTCPLDCYDGCSIVVEENLKLKGDKSHPVTQGFLCPHMNNYHKFKKITTPLLYKKPIELDEAIVKLAQKLKDTDPQKVLFYKGSGNLGVMQNVTKLFFSRYGAIIAQGSLCDKAGGFGIEEGRGANLALSPLHVAKSEVVILWGRNSSVSNSHMLPSLKGKRIIVIDPVRTALAKKADLHIAIEPKKDLYLALLLCKLIFDGGFEDRDFLKNRCENIGRFLALLERFSYEKISICSGVSIEQAKTLLSLLSGKKVSILVGIGVQKYSFGHSVLRAIDALGAVLGLFGKDGCGVGYLSNSGYGFDKPFTPTCKNQKAQYVAMSDFGSFDVVFIQGANPLSQTPCTPFVKDGLSRAGFVVYFGLDDNATCKSADLVIPAKTFLEKNDVKLTYGHEFVGKMPKVFDSEFGISEYDLCSKLNGFFGYEKMIDEELFISKVVDSNAIERDGYLISKSYIKNVYEDGFYTPSKKFHFIDSFEDTQLDGDFYLLSTKHIYSLNSQFKTDDYLYVPLSLGLKQDDEVVLSANGLTCRYAVKPSENLRDDCVMMHSGAKNANHLTPRALSQKGCCAVYQEVKVMLKRA
ncbi:MAG: molybdopterin-dependent oxidoreductase [Sulfurospirillaceae bacterium]|nr:molybdopterin-dependent oxidoreductase [Sulfurospirillaceae bacterium]MDD3462911.1 molybdopterin-dependent oxidoreductase [Sulfurospirillaceae bacterium]